MLFTFFDCIWGCHGVDKCHVLIHSSTCLRIISIKLVKEYFKVLIIFFYLGSMETPLHTRFLDLLHLLDLFFLNIGVLVLYQRPFWIFFLSFQSTINEFLIVFLSCRIHQNVWLLGQVGVVSIAEEGAWWIYSQIIIHLMSYSLRRVTLASNRAFFQCSYLRLYHCGWVKALSFDWELSIGIGVDIEVFGSGSFLSIFEDRCVKFLPVVLFEAFICLHRLCCSRIATNKNLFEDVFIILTCFPM